jgi:hypothetical protein
MANTFKNYRADVSDTLTAVYTVPSSTTAIIIGCQCANIHASDAGQLDLAWTDTSGSTTTYLIKGANVPNKSALAPIEGKVVLETGDIIKAKAAVASTLGLTLAVLEIT